VRIAVSPSGAVGARSSHAASASSSDAAGYVMRKNAAHPPDLHPHGGHDAEAPAAAAQGPVELLVAVGVDRALATVGGHDVVAAHAVDRQAELAAGQAHPTAGGQAADADGGARPGRRRHAAAGELRVDVDVAGAGADRGDRAVEADAVDRPHVDHHRLAADRRAVVGMAAGAHGQRHVEPVGPADHGLHVGGVAHAHHGGRADAVEPAVEQVAGRVVAALPGEVHRAADGAPQGPDLRLRQVVARERRDAQPDQRRRLHQFAPRQVHAVMMPI
jgi:hypothetical protein